MLSDDEMAPTLSSHPLLFLHMTARPAEGLITCTRLRMPSDADLEVGASESCASAMARATGSYSSSAATSNPESDGELVWRDLQEADLGQLQALQIQLFPVRNSMPCQSCCPHAHPSVVCRGR